MDITDLDIYHISMFGSAGLRVGFALLPWTALLMEASKYYVSKKSGATLGKVSTVSGLHGGLNL